MGGGEVGVVVVGWLGCGYVVDVVVGVTRGSWVPGTTCRGTAGLAGAGWLGAVVAVGAAVWVLAGGWFVAIARPPPGAG